MRPNTATTLAAPPRRAPGTTFNAFVEKNILTSADFFSQSKEIYTIYSHNKTIEHESLQNLILGRQRQPETAAAAATTSAATAAATTAPKQHRQPMPPTTTPSIPAASSASFALRATGMKEIRNMIPNRP